MDIPLPATADLAETRLPFRSMLWKNALALLAALITAFLANFIFPFLVIQFHPLIMDVITFQELVLYLDLFAGGLAMVFIQDKLVKPRLSRGRRWALYLVGGLLLSAWVFAALALWEGINPDTISQPFAILVEMLGRDAFNLAVFFGIILALTGFLGLFSAMLLNIRAQRRWWVFSLVILFTGVGIVLQLIFPM